MNALKHARYAKLAYVLPGESKDAFHALLQSFVDRSKLPQFLTAPEAA